VRLISDRNANTVNGRYGRTGPNNGRAHCRAIHQKHFGASADGRANESA
jgi:hypothetical protein